MFFGDLGCAGRDSGSKREMCDSDIEFCFIV